MTVRYVYLEQSQGHVSYALIRTYQRHLIFPKIDLFHNRGLKSTKISLHEICMKRKKKKEKKIQMGVAGNGVEGAGVGPLLLS